MHWILGLLLAAALARAEPAVAVEARAEAFGVQPLRPGGARPRDAPRVRVVAQEGALAAEPDAAEGPVRAWLEATAQGQARKRAALEKEAVAAKDAEALGRWATLVVANLYRIGDHDKVAVVEDWENDGEPTELRFEGKGTPKEQADAAFAKARRLRRGSAVLEDLLAQCAAAEQRVAAWTARLDEGEDADALRAEIVPAAKKLQLKVTGLAPQPTAPRREPQQQQPLAASRTAGWTGREFTSPQGIPILVGRNSRENELLTLQIAKDPDVWMHVRGKPGSHVVLQVSRVQKVPGEEDLQMAADLAAFYSDLGDENRAPVTFTSPKYITKPKGANLGAVRLRKEDGTLTAHPTGKKSLVPTDVQDLRAQERQQTKKAKKKK